MANLEEILSAEARSARRKGVQRSESAKVSHQRQPMLQSRKQSEPQFDINQTFCDPPAGGQGGSPEVQSTQQSTSSSNSSIADTRTWPTSGSQHSSLEISPQTTARLANIQTPGISHQTLQQLVDTDLLETDHPDWRLSLSQEALHTLKLKEQKRQDVINELFHTEKSHIRNLKVLEHVFRQPLQESGLMPKEIVDRLFPNLDDVLEVHQRHYNFMKEELKNGFPIGNIGCILSNMFLDTYGDHLVKVGAEFTKNQKSTIEELKHLRLRDSKLEQFLSDCERNPACRRLQLQSLLAMEHQRLVKYPLLLEQLLRHTEKSEEGEECETVRIVMDKTKEILDNIDKQVAEAQNKQRMVDIQSNLDKSGLDRHSDNPICIEYRNLDLTQRRLIYDGTLTLKLGDAKRVKNIDLHVLLLEDCIMLIQKQDEKYLLKFYSSSSGPIVPGKDDSKKLYHSPIIKFSTMLVRPVATDKRAFYLLNTTQDGPQIYELVANSAPERSVWYKQITEAVNTYKSVQATRRSYSGASDTGVPEDNTDGERGTARSQSFHEPAGRQRENQVERQASSPPEAMGVGGETPTASQRRRLQRVEILKIAEVVPLIDPSQVRVTQDMVLMADPVVTPIEKLRIKDEEVAKALEEKQRLIEDIFNIPQDEFDTVADFASIPGQNADAKEVLIAALAQAKSLTNYVNQSLSVPDEASAALGQQQPDERQGTPGPVADPQLTNITTAMNRHLTTLLEIIQERDNERERLRQDLLRSQEQVKALITSGGLDTTPQPLLLQHNTDTKPPQTPSITVPVTPTDTAHNDTQTSASPSFFNSPPSSCSPSLSFCSPPPPPNSPFLISTDTKSLSTSPAPPFGASHNHSPSPTPSPNDTSHQERDTKCLEEPSDSTNTNINTSDIIVETFFEDGVFY